MLLLADLLQAASLSPRRAGGGLPGLAPVQAPHVHRRQPRHAPRDGPLPGRRHAPARGPRGLTPAPGPHTKKGPRGRVRPLGPPARHAGRLDTRGGPLRSRGGGLPWQNAPWWPAASCSPTDSLRSTIGARGLNFRVRDGTGCASPAMAAGRQGAFCCFGAGLAAVPSGPHSVTGSEDPPRGSRRKSSAD